MVLDCVLLILLLAMLALRLGHLPFKLLFKRKKKTILAILALFCHLVSAYLNSLRLKVYFCEIIIINQCNCIWHLEPLASIWRSTAHPSTRKGAPYWKQNIFGALTLPFLGVQGWKPHCVASEPERCSLALCLPWSAQAVHLALLPARQCGFPPPAPSTCRNGGPLGLAFHLDVCLARDALGSFCGPFWFLTWSKQISHHEKLDEVKIVHTWAAPLVLLPLQDPLSIERGLEWISWAITKWRDLLKHNILVSPPPF